MSSASSNSRVSDLVRAARSSGGTVVLEAERPPADLDRPEGAAPARHGREAERPASQAAALGHCSSTTGGSVGIQSMPPVGIGAIGSSDVEPDGHVAIVARQRERQRRIGVPGLREARVEIDVDAVAASPSRPASAQGARSGRTARLPQPLPPVSCRGSSPCSRSPRARQQGRRPSRPNSLDHLLEMGSVDRSRKWRGSARRRRRSRTRSVPRRSRRRTRACAGRGSTTDEPRPRRRCSGLLAIAPPTIAIGHRPDLRRASDRSAGAGIRASRRGGAERAAASWRRASPRRRSRQDSRA